VVLLAVAVSPALAQKVVPPEPYQVFFPLAENSHTNPRGISALLADRVQTYVLRAGDNLAELAFDLGRDLSAMACVTPSGTYPLRELRPGQTLLIPPPYFLCHTVAQGETIAGIARRYQVDPQVILQTPWNEVTRLDTPLEPGRRLLVYGGIPPEMPRTRPPSGRSTDELWPYGDGDFVWPVAGRVSQDFDRSHRALDIAAPLGRDVVASDNGVVILAGWSDIGYGLRVVIDHQVDYTTLYGHLSEILVEEGQVVEKGQVIGQVGSTGNSSGPHVHFEVRDFGYLANPLQLLP
jgi:hypothetical protein